MADTSQQTMTKSKGRRYIFDLPEGFPTRREFCKEFQNEATSDRKRIFNFLGLPAELRNLIYSYATTLAHDPQGDRVCITRQEPGEYRDFTGLPHVCKTIHREYTTTLTRNTTVAVHAADVDAYVEAFYPDRDDALKHGDLQVVFIAYGEPVVGSSLCETFNCESPALNVSTLLDLQCRLRQIRVSFVCFLATFIDKKPIYWDQMTDDFNELFSATHIEGPALPDTDTPPSILPDMVEYFADKTDYELTVTSRWPKPGQELSYHPAIVFNVKFDALKNPGLPFAEHWHSRDEVAKLAHTLWFVDEVVEVDDTVVPRYNLYDMMAFLSGTTLHDRWSPDWFVNFQREAIEPQPESSSMSQDDDETHAPTERPFRPVTGQHEEDAILIDTFHAIAAHRDVTYSSTDEYSLDEIRVTIYKHLEEQRSNTAAPPPQPPLYPDRSEDDELPSVFRELLREAGVEGQHYAPPQQQPLYPDRSEDDELPLVFRELLREAGITPEGTLLPQ